MSTSFFSISFSLVTTQVALPYDLYINSSSIEGRERFVRIHRRGEIIASGDLAHFETKYHRIYVVETQRSLFLKSLVSATGATPERKTEILKDSAIHHLKNLFGHEQTPETMGKTLTECRDVVEGMIDVLEDYNIDKLRELIASLSFHDFYTFDHSVNVCMYSILLFRLMRPDAPRPMIMLAGMSGLLHDLGKIKISTQILNKTEKLDEQEFSEIKRHPGYGHELLRECRLHLPQSIDTELLARVIFEHHENFNGTGYPQGLAGEDIHFLSRITAIADFFDAVTTKRSYHEPLSPLDALAIMQKTEGKKLDPKIFRAFEENTRAGKIHRISRKELPEDFDPCQPHRVLPLIDTDGKPEADDGKGFGNVTVLELPKDRSDNPVAVGAKAKHFVPADTARPGFAKKNIIKGKKA
ncbi:MAG: HD domain-containing phosphohydrolase [Oligoflexia bacterium]|nr:HD domain-containing phosphohydrolase [Oligoflexia bacterium]